MGSRKKFKRVKQAAQQENLSYRADNALSSVISEKTGHGNYFAWGPGVSAHFIAYLENSSWFSIS